MAACPIKTPDTKIIEKYLGKKLLDYIYINNGATVPLILQHPDFTKLRDDQGEEAAVKELIQSIPTFAGLFKMDPVEQEAMLQSKNDILGKIVARSNELNLEKTDGVEADEYTKGDTTYQRVSKFIKQLTGAFTTNKDDEEWAESTVVKIWDKGNIPAETALEFPNIKMPMNREQYKAHQMSIRKHGKLKGKIVHTVLQKVFHPEKSEELNGKLQEYFDEIDVKPATYDWLLDEEVGVLPALLSKVGINWYKTDNKAELDKVESEVTVYSDTWGVAGTVDTLVQHYTENDEFPLLSIIDWKTGSRFDKEFTSKLFKYANQADKMLFRGQRNEAKLQIMMYALLLKTEFPNAKFKNLNVAWITDEYSAKARDANMAVETVAYLNMIKKALSDPKFIAEAGLPTDILQQLNAKSPNLFNASDYNYHKSNKLEQEIIENIDNPRKLLEEKIFKLNTMIQGVAGMWELSREDKAIATELLKEIQELQKDPNMNLNIISPDLGMENWIMNMSDISDPRIKLWGRFKTERTQKLNEVYLDKMYTFRKLLKPVYEKYMQGRLKINVLGLQGAIQNVDYEELFKFAYVEEIIGDKRMARLITKEDQGLYGALTTDEQALLDYVNETTEDYFKYFDKPDLTNAAGKQISMLQKAAPGFKYYKGFFFKIAKTNSELVKEQGGELTARFTKKYWQEQGKKEFSYFVENNYEGEGSEVALPIKYLGNEVVDKEGMFSKNLEFIFSQGVFAMEYKKQLDDVYSLGRTLHYVFDNTFHKGKKLQPNYAAWIDDQLEAGVRGMPIRSQIGKRNMRLFGKEVPLDKVVTTLSKWSSANVMWMRPIQGAANATVAGILTIKEGMVDTLARKLGLQSDYVTYGTRHHMNGLKEWSKYQKDSIFDNLDNNKIWQLVKHFNYLPANIMQMNNLELMTTKNKIMDESIGFSPYSETEKVVAMDTLYATLKSMTYKNAEGKQVSLWDSYDVKDGKVTWTGGIRGYKQVGAALDPITELTPEEINKVRYLYERVQGGYRSKTGEATRMEAYTMSNIFLSLRKYLPRIIMNAFKSKAMNYELGKYQEVKDSETGEVLMNQGMPVLEWVALQEEGKWRTLGNMAIALINGNEEYKWKNLDELQKRNLLEASMTFIALVGAFMTYTLLFDDVDDDDTFKQMYWNYLVLNTSQQYNFIDWGKSIKNMSPVVVGQTFNMAEGAFKFATALSTYPVYGDEALFTKEGAVRGWLQLRRAIPVPYISKYTSAYYDLVRKLSNNEDVTFYGNEWFYKTK